MNVTTKKILGKGKNLYLINWSYVANFGFELIMADNEKDAYEKHIYSKNKEVNFIITKISKKHLPVIFKKEIL